MQPIQIKQLPKTTVLRLKDSKVVLPHALQAKVDRHWQTLLRANGKLTNGEVFTAASVKHTASGTEIELVETNYAHYLYSQQIGGLGKYTVRIIHSAALVITADDKLLFGEMGRHTSRHRVIQCSGGGFDHDDVRSGIVDIEHNVAKELYEELGIDLYDQDVVRAYSAAYLKLGGPTGKMTVVYLVYIKPTADAYMKQYQAFATNLQAAGEEPEFGRLFVLDRKQAAAQGFIADHAEWLDEYMPILLQTVTEPMPKPVFPSTKKSLGQHWLEDDASLAAMVEAADVTAEDTVLEIGPGPGTLTAKLVARAKKVVAVEFDEALAADLAQRVQAANLEIVHQDILKFDVTTLPVGYKVAANIPYYLTSNLLRVLCESPNPFSKAALLVQKEVADRVSARPGAMSLLSVSVQFYCEASLGAIIPAKLFRPPPKVDSQILRLSYRQRPLFPDVDRRLFFRIVKAGFAQRRKTLLNSLSSGLQLSREQTIAILEDSAIDPSARPQDLSLDYWHNLYLAATSKAFL